MSGIVASHWVVAPVILPAFVAAFLILVLRHSLAYQRIVSIAATALLLAIAIRNFSVAGEGPAQPYMLGAWPAPFGIVLVLDPLSATMVLLAACSRWPSSSMPLRVGTLAAGISTRSFSSSSWASTARS